MGICNNKNLLQTEQFDDHYSLIDELKRKKGYHMNFNQLEYFVCAAENLNFTRAAAQCFISQTAMTQQIQALEKKVGVPLFIRDKHHVELTTAGEVYLKEARGILKKNEEALRLARLATTGTEGEISIGFISGFGQSDCGDILRGFHEAFPNIKIKLIRDTLSGISSSLIKKECDVAFMIKSNTQQSDSLNHMYFKSYPIMVAMGQGHLLAQNNQVSCAELRNEKFILMQPAARSRDEMEEVVWVYSRGGFLPEVVAVEKEPETIFLMVSLGFGVCLMPEYIVRPYQHDENLTFLPVVSEDGTAETLDCEIVWSKNNDNPALARLFQWWESR